MVAFVGLLIFISCDEGEFVEPFDPNVQFMEDLMTIEDFISDRGLDPVDTTDTSVRYAVTNNGDGSLVEVDDIVTLDFTTYLAETGQLLQTTLQEVADTSDFISVVADPLVFRHTVNGWAFNDLFSQRSGASTSINGFRDGVTLAFNSGHNGLPEIEEGATITILVPSQAVIVTVNGATSRPQGFPTAVYAYEVAVRHVRK